MIKLALLVIIGLLFLFIVSVFVVALIATIKKLRKPPAVGINADLGFSGELGVRLIKKGQPLPQ